MTKRWTYWLAWVLITVAAAAGVDGLEHFRFFQLLSLKAYDTNFVLRGKRPTSGIVLVVVDEKTLNTFDELQALFHPYYAQAIKGAEMGGAKAVGLDAAFGIKVDRWAKDADQVMAEAVATAKIPVVVGFVPALLARQHDWVIPVNMLASALGLAGYSNLTTDPDDFIRRQELMEAPATGDAMPARGFALRIAEKALGQDAVLQNGRLTLAGKNIPIDAERTIDINFVGPADTLPRISLSDFVAATKAGNTQQLKDWVGGKIVLIGPDNPVGDRYSTPYFTSLQGGSKWNTAGVEIHASVISTILDNAYILPAPAWVRFAMLMAIAFVTFGAATALRTGWVAAASIAILAAALGASQLLFLSHYSLPASDLGGSWLLSLIPSIGYRFVAAENRRDHFRRAVKMFVGKKAATELDQTNVIALTGKREMVTILFTDIRGFTAFCEDKDPSEVVSLLNDYMRLMVSIIVKHHGQVNKFIGDGILAIFSEEPPDEQGNVLKDHAVRGVECAVEMVNAPSPFKTGAGLHTGMVVVGNVGSEDKMEYTVLGDTVNLASRLESLNKENKTKLLMTGVTQSRVGDLVPATRLGAVPVRGKIEPVEIFTATSLMVAHDNEHAPAAEIR